MTAPLLQLEGVEKSFVGARALKPLRLELHAGEILGLIGENGAGKSTLIKILSGVHAPDAGAMLWQGREVRFTSPFEAMQAGIATIHQELACCIHLSVAENMLLGEPWPRHWFRGVDWDRLHLEARRRLARFDLDTPTEWSFSRLGAALRQEVAIAGALSRQARLLVLDEPTASLSEPEVQRLFARLQSLRQQGVAILYVSHRLDEILKLTDRVAVLRDGELVALHPTRELTANRLVKEMVGRPLEQFYPHTRTTRHSEPLLELDNVTRAGAFQAISFQVHAGEIVGLTGLLGAGCSELGRAIYGLIPIDGGTMRLGGNPWKPAGAPEALAAGLAYLPEERKRQGLVPDHSLGDSISIGFNDLLTRWGLIALRREAAQVQHAMKSFDVRAAGPRQPVGTLSGGNQQKAMLARWLERGPRVVILNEPTRGVDVGARAEIHALMDRLAGEGTAVLVISSDLTEMLGMSERVFVLHRGALSAELQGEAMTQENVILAASGLLKK